MPKCRDNLRRKRRIAKKEARIKKWCENYFLGGRGGYVNLIGGYNYCPHPWRKRKHAKTKGDTYRI